MNPRFVVSLISILAGVKDLGGQIMAPDPIPAQTTIRRDDEAIAKAQAKRDRKAAKRKEDHRP